jgi:hypothetical protein|tara:strand:+ start:514 stop:1752 length:1239 start_codon:yes stop_codon:yes gene_type:complete
MSLSYYSNVEVQKEILKSAKFKEVAIRYGEKGFGKRPDTLHYESDVIELAKQGATSFHISEEHWTNPQSLTPGMTKKQLETLRRGWDFILDIDSPNLEHSKWIAHFLIQALKFHNTKNISLKFSGNKGFHIGVPFESFPSKIKEVETKTLFPEAARIIAEYLTEMITSYVKEKFNDESMDDILKVDTILISNRHLYRAPYSLHEKSGLASIPIDPDKVLEFTKSEADPKKVKINFSFLDKFEKDEASELVTAALDWNHERELKKNFIQSQKNNITKEYDELSESIPEGFFPPCIKFGLNGLKDGKKRFLFILINFLKCVAWPHDEIEKRIKEWNKNNPEPLKEGYILSQLSWHKRQKEKVLPPNCSNEGYYKDLRICDPDNLCSKIKNPVNYAVRQFNISKKQKKKLIKRSK